MIYPGNTMFEPDVRGGNLVQRIGLRCFLRVRARHPWRPVFLFYDTDSYKSYLMLPRNFAEFWPRRDRPLPASIAASWTSSGAGATASAGIRSAGSAGARAAS
ncbi:MAG TPA: hypothetical protein VMR23_05890 [Candidatus Limnocylindria bacterium]|nr:hypothetical protein [Candidatus Limnocylindria bacterium]